MVRGPVIVGLVLGALGAVGLVLDARDRRPRGNPGPPLDERGLRALFDEERALFALRFPCAAHAWLEIVDGRCPDGGTGCRWRVFAQADRAGLVTVSRRILDLTIDNVRGLVRHELGHVADDRFDEPHAEQRADDLAWAATGQRIRYDDRDLETTGAGRWPRPGYLHR